MALLLGVDTGGTFTDAVLIRDEKTVVASAKALTTRHDLAIGIGEAVEAVLREVAAAPGDITLASLSTTLATNALVEGQGGRVALIFIGFRARDLQAQGLADALSGDPHILLPGGHDHAGQAVEPLDEGSLASFLETHKDDVSGFAVAGRFATRNPAHEQRAAELVHQITGRPVTAAHQLSAKLNGPKRAITAVLNARLVGMIDRLISRAGDKLANLGIDAPLMVVRGDGALISAAQARERPIETILSGPAASIVGARWLTGAQEALVSDIGGTTTDIAVLSNGRPVIDPAGARVGPYRTMVEAVAMRTTGLGGDSAVHFVSEGLDGGVTLGPQRRVPVSLLAVEAPEVVHAALDAQLRTAVPGEFDGRFVRGVPGQATEGLGAREQALLNRIGTTVAPLAEVLRARIDQGPLKRLIARGLVQDCGVTPSDAAHVLLGLSSWDRNAAEKALLLFGRRRTGAGMALSERPCDMARMIVDRMTQQTIWALLETAISGETPEFDQDPSTLARHVLMQRGLEQSGRFLRVETGLHVPVVGLGASAHAYYPAVGKRLRSDVILPKHASVANAIGAVVSRVTMRQVGQVTAPSEGKYRVHFPDGPQDFTDQEEAISRLEALLSAEARERAQAAGAVDVQLQIKRDIRTVAVEAREIFVEATVTVEAAGRPRMASG